MSVEIIYTKQPSHLMDRIKSCIDRGEKVLYIVPEQFSFNADKLLLETLGERYSHLTETVNFKRLATMINHKYQPNEPDYIDDETKSLILYNIIRQNTSLLSTIQKRANRPDSVMIFKHILSECSGYLIGHEALEQIKNSLPQESLLYRKICDLDRILIEYEKAIATKFRDFEDSFQTLAGYIESEGLYRDYHIFIDHFTNFSPAEFLVISALMKQAAHIGILLMLNDTSPKAPGDLFYPTQKTYEKLKQMAQKAQVPFRETPLPQTESSFFADLFDGIPKTMPEQKIVMVNAKSIHDEVRFVADTIQKKVASGASYSDFTVLTGDLSLYRAELEQVFYTASIPCFLDAKTPLTQNPLSKIFLNLFFMVISAYEKNAVLEYVKSLCSVYDIHREVCMFEELLHRFHIQKQGLSNPEKWNQTCQFLQAQQHYLSRKLPEIQGIYQAFLLPVITNFPAKGGYLSAFQNYTEQIGLEQAVRTYLEQSEAVFCKETVTAYNTIFGVIKNIDLLIRDEDLSMDDYYHILKYSLELYESGEIPDTLDTVTASDIDRGRSLSSPYVFLIGMNESVTPKTTVNTSYLSDIEREMIADITGIEIPTSLHQNCDSLLALYRAFLTAQQQIYLSKNDAEEEQCKRMPCHLWSRLEQFFQPLDFQEACVSIPEFTQQALMAYENPYKQRLTPQKPPETLFYGEKKQELFGLWSEISSMKEHHYYATDKKLSKKITNSLYQKGLNASVSRLEAYQKCAYSYFIQYILKISQREDVSFDFQKTGSIVHNLFEKFSKSLMANGLNWETMDDAFIESQVETLVPLEIQRSFPNASLFNPRTKYLIHKIKRLLKYAIGYIREHFHEGEFFPVGYEILIQDDGIPPLSIALEDGSLMQIYGKIDRCDVAKKDDRLYVRIIDYKSSAKEFRFALIKDGIQLQLLTYLRTVVKNGGKYLNFAGEILPGAVFYTSFHDSLLPFTDRPAPDEIQSEIQKKFRMKGFVLNDDSLIQAIDKHLGEEINYQSSVCDIKTDKSGQYRLKNFLFLEEFNRLLNDCEETIKTIGTKMIGGEISIHPYRYGKETGCDWCQYRSICMFDPKMHSYRNITSLTKEEYLSGGRKEGEENGIHTEPAAGD